MAPVTAPAVGEPRGSMSANSATRSARLRIDLFGMADPFVAPLGARVDVVFWPAQGYPLPVRVPRGELGSFVTIASADPSPRASSSVQMGWRATWLTITSIGDTGG